MSAIELVAAERQRQVEQEGYTAEHDAGHAEELARAASCYAMTPGYRQTGSAVPEWPWDPVYWKPTPDDRRRELVKAGALIAAAIDALEATR